MADRELPTAEYVRQILDYNPETGRLRWKPRTPEIFADGIKYSASQKCARWNTRYAGIPAGRINNMGYLGIRISGKHFYAHRLAWLYVTWEWPTREIDHIDGDPLNNRFCNLREASRLQNCANLARRKDNKTGIKGVSFDKTRERFVAQIARNGKHFHLGRFKKIEDAHSAYASAAAKLFGDFERK